MPLRTVAGNRPRSELFRPRATCDNDRMLKPDVDVVLRPPQPAAARVARRALALCAVACRSQLEPHAGDAEARAIHDSVRGWLAAARVDAEFEDDERRIVETPLGQLSRDDATLAGWRGEGAAVLAWGLGRWSLPAIDENVDAADVAMQLDWLADDPPAFAESARLRARTDVVQLAEMLEVAQWRLERELAGEQAISLRNFDAGSFQWARDAEPLKFAEDGDIAVAGQALAAAPEHAKRVALRIVMERRRAVNWLAGQHALYSAVDAGA
jgi:hypothetical protein